MTGNRVGGPYTAAWPHLHYTSTEGYINASFMNKPILPRVLGIALKLDVVWPGHQ